MTVTTPHGDFKMIRKDAVAFSVIKTKRAVTHLGKRRERGEITHTEHRKIPKLMSRASGNCSPWGEWIATYDLSGKKIELLNN